MESKIRPIQELNKEIADTKNILNNNESILTNRLIEYHTPEKKRSHIFTDSTATQQSTSELNTKRESYRSKDINDEQIPVYIKNLKKLCTSLQEKCYALQVDYRKSLTAYQYKQSKQQQEICSLNQKLDQMNKEVEQKKITLVKLEKADKQKQQQISLLRLQMAGLRKDNVQLKMQSKNYRAQNKIIIKQLQRLTNQKNNSKDCQQTLQQKEYRVRQSLYKVNNPTFEHDQAVKRYQASCQLSNKIMLDDALLMNSELKSCIRRLNQKIQILKKQKAWLIQQVKNKTENLESQKHVTKLKEQNIQQLNNVISKMGDKIMKLQQFNQSLKRELEKQETPTDTFEDNYYRTMKTKIGQFYYRK